MKQLAVSLPQPTNSLNESKRLALEEAKAKRVPYAAERARLLFGCYRKGDANDPETYTMAVTAILAEYEEAIIQRVTDPRTGIARTSKWMPNVAEVSEACDTAKKEIETEEKLKRIGWEWDGERYVKATP